MYNLYHHATMNSQFYGWHHLPVIQVLVDGKTTYEDVKDMLLNVYYSTDHIEDLNTEEYIKAVEVLFKDVKLDEVFDDRLDVVEEAEDWDDYDCYAFFVLETDEVEEDE